VRFRVWFQVAFPVAQTAALRMWVAPHHSSRFIMKVAVRAKYSRIWDR